MKKGRKRRGWKVNKRKGVGKNDEGKGNFNKDKRR